MVDGIVDEKFSNQNGLFSRLFAWNPEDDKSEQHIQMAPIDPAMWIEFEDQFESSEESEEESEYSDEEEDEEDDNKNEKNDVMKEEKKKEENNPYHLSIHEIHCIENVLECIDKCRLDLFLPSSIEWSNNTLLTFIQSALHLYEYPYRNLLSFYLSYCIELSQCNEDGPHRTSTIACMYTHCFVIELLTGLAKVNIKRFDIMKDQFITLLNQTVEQATSLNLELITIIECVYDLIYTCIQANSISPIHKLLGILTAISHLPQEIFQELAPIVASGLAVLVAEFGKSLPIIGCWNLIVDLLNSCLIEAHAMRYLLLIIIH